ncbi:MAG: mechanosensitive ion channel [Sandaracinus sp.]|nr:mechanosensitive ion channel [Sandaracinus sp.]
MDWLTDVLGRLREALQIDLFEISGTRITLMTAVTALVVMGLTLLISRLLRKVVRRAFAIRGAVDDGTVNAVASLLHYVVLFVGFGIALQTVGINLSALFAAGAVFAVAIGFAMQTVAQSFVAGVMLLVERTIRPGDVLVIDGKVVKVSRLGIRATVVETLDGEHVLVPNDSLVREKITNLSYEHSDVRVTVMVGVAYESDLDATIEALEEAARSMKNAVTHRTPAVFLESFGDSSVNFRVCAWLGNPWASARFASDLRLGVWRALKKAEITIAFPQLDVHFDREATIRLDRAA